MISGEKCIPPDFVTKMGLRSLFLISPLRLSRATEDLRLIEQQESPDAMYRLWKSPVGLQARLSCRSDHPSASPHLILKR